MSASGAAAELVDEAEVVVVGAGPCGSTCAATLAERGHDVLLVDQDDLPRHKPCGDGLTPSTVVALRHLGIDAVLDGAYEIEGVRGFVDFEEKGVKRFLQRRGAHGNGRCVTRYVLDAALRDAAVERGVRFRRLRVDRPLIGEHGASGVVGKVDGAVVRVDAKYVVAADGATSRMRREAGLPGRSEHRLTAYAARSYFRTEAPLAPLYDGFVPVELEGEQFMGYGWVFPLEEHLANIGIGYFRGPGLKHARSLRAVLDEFIDHLERFAGGIYGRIEHVDGPIGSPVAVEFDADRCEAHGIAFVGDAAGTTDPFTGEGIQAAVLGGQEIALRVHEAACSATAVRHVGRSLGRLFPRSGQDLAAGLRLSASVVEVGGVAAEPVEPGSEPMARSIRRMLIAADRTDPVQTTATWRAVTRLDAGCGAAIEATAGLALDHLRTRFPFALELANREFLAYGGPAAAGAVLLCAQALGAELDDEVLSIAVGAECARLAGRFMFNVVDVHESRRQRYGNAYALLISDYVTVRAASLVAPLHDQEVARRFARATRDALLGFGLRTAARYDADPSAAAYLRAASLLEAPPFGFGCWLVARRLGADPEVCEQLATYGTELGTATMLAADAVALLVGDPVLGSAPGEPLREGIYSLAFIEAAQADPSLRAIYGSRATEDESMLAASRVLAGRAPRAVVDRATTHIWAAKRAARAACNGAAEPLVDYADLPASFLRDRLVDARYADSIGQLRGVA